MIETPFFSIIVPIYNSEIYLRECIDSVLNQSFGDFELILVNDGSTDNSKNIIEEYARKDKRIKCINKDNGGEFSSRMAALNIARGIYITGLDSDDYFETNHLEIIKNTIDKYKCDVVMHSFTMFGAINDKIVIPRDALGLKSGEDFLLWVLESTMHSFCSKTIRKALFDNVDYSFVPNVRISEDYLMVVPALCYCKNAFVMDLYTYYYRIHHDSASNTVSFDKIYDLCRVSDFGLKYLNYSNLSSNKYEISEHIGFYKVVIDRLIKSIENNNLSNKELDMIRNTNAFRSAIKAEKIRYMGLFNFFCLKFLRIRCYFFLRMIIHFRKSIICIFLD